MPEDPTEIFQRAWIKIRENEISGKLPVIQNYVGYFSRVCYHCRMDIRREIKQRDKEINIIDRIESDYTDKFKTFVDHWVNDMTEDENLNFYKGLLQILLACQFNKSEFLRMAKMGRQTLYLYLDETFKLLQDDWTRFNSTDIDNF